jgi:hypothetical protein
MPCPSRRATLPRSIGVSVEVGTQLPAHRLDLLTAHFGPAGAGAKMRGRYRMQVLRPERSTPPVASSVEKHHRATSSSTSTSTASASRKRPGDKKASRLGSTYPEAVVCDFAEWRFAIGRPKGLVFPKPSGNAWSKSGRGNWRRRWFSKAAAGAGYPQLQPRDLRRTCASLLAAVSTPPVEIEAQMSHRPTCRGGSTSTRIEELRGTRLSIDELIARARAEAFGDAESREAAGA